MLGLADDMAFIIDMSFAREADDAMSSANCVVLWFVMVWSEVFLLRLLGLEDSPLAGLLADPPPAPVPLCESRSCLVRRSLNG